MTQPRQNECSRVVYIRDAKDCKVTRNLLDSGRMELKDAVDLALAKHRTGENPVIIGTSLQLVGIDAIRAVRKADIKQILLRTLRQ